jgi:hypothetical protein
MIYPKKDVKNTRLFHLVNPSELNGLQEFAEWLEAILHNPCSIWNKDGDEIIIEIKQLVGRVDGLKIEIYPNDHPPPHFHIRSPGVDASFSIDNCDKLEGNINGHELRKIKYWFKYAKPPLIENWNSTRPTDITVNKTC